MKLVALFRDSLRVDDLLHWRELFTRSSELAGAPRGFFVSEGGLHVPLGDMWSESSEDDDAIQRIAENLEIICCEICNRTVDPRFVYYELGQLLTVTHRWLVEITETGTKSFIDQNYPWMKRAFVEYGDSFSKWPCRTYAYIE